MARDCAPDSRFAHQKREIGVFELGMRKRFLFLWVWGLRGERAFCARGLLEI